MKREARTAAFLGLLLFSASLGAETGTAPSLPTAASPAAASGCHTAADCDDHNPCTADSCSSGTCIYMVTCASAEAPPPPPSTPSDPVAYAACLKVCVSQPCWSAWCTPDGQCMKMATCASASAPPPPPPTYTASPVGVIVLPYTPPPPPPASSLPPPPPPPPGLIPSQPLTPPSLIPSVPFSPPGLIPSVPLSPPPVATPELPIQPPLKRCEDLAGVMHDCCLKYDDKRNGGNGDGIPNGMELARMIRDDDCRPKTGPSAVGDLCANFTGIVASDGSSVTVSGVNQCCQIVRNSGDIENTMVSQNCANVGVVDIAVGPSSPSTAAAGAAATNLEAKGASAEGGAKADNGGCGLTRIP